jgi:glutaredoxin
VDIEKQPEKLVEMLVYSKGDDHVPVIVEEGNVRIGFSKEVFMSGRVLLHGGT